MKKGVYRRIYLLLGSQDYMKNRCIKAIVAAHLPEDDTMNLSRYFGKKTDIKEVIALSDTMPFLAEKRIIIIEGTDYFSHTCEELADYIPNIPESTILIFSEEKADARLKHTKAVKSEGGYAEFDNLPEKELRDWVSSRLRREHRQITEKAFDLFMNRCGADMWEISNDLEKLISYTFGKEGRHREDVDAVCPAPPEDKIFAMIDAILAGNSKRALMFYTDLLALRSDPMGILKLLREQLRLLLHAKDLDRGRMNPQEMGKLLGMKEGRVRMALPAARKSSTIILTKLIEMCAEVDERIKTGLVDAQIGIETLIVEMSEITGGN